MPTTSLLAVFPNPIHQKRPLERLGKPYAIMRSENGTSYVYKDSNGDESSFSTQAIRSSMLHLLQKPSS